MSRNLCPHSPGALVVSLDLGYGGVKKLLKYVCAQRGAVHDELVVPLPLSVEQVVLDLVRTYLEQHKGGLVAFQRFRFFF